jgi:hypothetical protein
VRLRTFKALPLPFLEGQHKQALKYLFPQTSLFAFNVLYVTFRWSEDLWAREKSRLVPRRAENARYVITASLVRRIKNFYIA